MGKDQNRQMNLESLGIQVIRFTSKEVVENMNRVLETIRSYTTDELL